MQKFNIISTIRFKLKNAFTLTITNFIVKFLAFLWLIYFVRSVAVIDYGKYAFAYSFNNLFEPILAFGFWLFILREIPICPEKTIKKYVLNIVCLQIIFSVLLYFSVFLVCKVNNFDTPMQTIFYLCAGFFVFYSIGITLQSVLQAKDKIAIPAILNIAEKVLFIILGIFAIKIGGDIVSIARNLFFLALLRVVLLLLVLSHYGFIKTQNLLSSIDFKFIIELLKKSFPFALIYFLSTLYFKVDISMLAFLKSAYDVGIYSAAFKIIETLVLLEQSAGIILMPIIASLWDAGKKEELKTLILKSVKFLSLLIFPLIFLVFTNANWLMKTLLGSKYNLSTIPLMILVISLFPIVLTSIFSKVIMCANKEKVIIYTVGVACIVNILLNLVLIPHYSFVGASLATLITSFLTFFIHLKLLKRTVVSISIFSFLKIPTFIFALGLIGVLLYPYSVVKIIFFPIFLCALFAFNYFDDEDKKIISGLILNKSK